MDKDIDRVLSKWLRHAGLDPASTFFKLAGMHRDPAVYIMASGFHGTLYTGVTSDPLGRVYQHREGVTHGFTSRYGVKRLVWFELHGTMETAMAREKQLKNWRRQWKIELIEEENPTWRDLAEDFGFETLVKKVDAGSSPA